jgi:Zn-dependent protease with chaperone function/Zn-finger nucleic acid-binding protein
MICPRCQGAQSLHPAMTQQGVEIDQCPACGGIWLDKGEIFHFARVPRTVGDALQAARQGATPGDRPSPKGGEPMLRLRLSGEGEGEARTIELDQCPTSGGLWLDPGELDRLLERSGGGIRLTLAERSVASPTGGPASDADRLRSIAAAARPLPNLVLRSVGVLAILYALVGLILISAVELGGLGAGAAVSIGVGIVLFQFLLGPFLMDLSLRWFYKCRFVTPEELPPHLAAFIARVSAEHKIRSPRIGMIDDGAPNAFTYGHHPGNARIVITRGILELLDEREVEAVVAHEIGHAVHWDMLVMTVAYLVPLISFYVYRLLVRADAKDDRLESAKQGVAIGAYLVYVVSEYIVLWLSRTREYWADRFGGEATGDPNALARALCKIGYGLAARSGGERTERKKGAEETPAKERGRAGGRLEALGALGIFSASAARSLAVASSRGGAGGAAGLERENLIGAMRWDLWNPWAKFYELHSTHPLIANRLDHLGRQAAARGQEPFIVFDEKRPESYWDEFLVDLGILLLPILLALVPLGLGLALGSTKVLALAVSGLGVGMLLKTFFSYRSGAFPEMDVAALLKQVKVSGVRGVPCTVRGTVIGRGVPGLIWSEDFVLRDGSGIIFLDYRQPLRIFELLFGLLRRAKLDGEEAVAVGWYRRAPVPYIELSSIDVQGKRRRCWVYAIKLALAVLLAAGGIALATLG